MDGSSLPIENKPLPSAWGITKDERNMKKKSILYFVVAIFLVSLTGCQNLAGFVNAGECNMFDVFRTGGSYNPNDPFPKKGYTLQGINYRNVIINKFTDNDTMYYIKYNPRIGEEKFYYTFINKETADILIANSRDNKKRPNVYDREKWLDDALIKMGIKNRADKNSVWTYFVPDRKLVKGNSFTEVVRTGYHYEYEKFNYKTATAKLYQKRNPSSKYKGMQAIGALFIMSMLSNNKQKESEYKTQWDMYSDAQKAAIHEHDNAK